LSRRAIKAEDVGSTVKISGYCPKHCAASSTQLLHVSSAQRRLGVFDADTKDGYDIVRSFAYGIESCTRIIRECISARNRSNEPTW
jgi:hypothetical protein